MQRMDDPLSVEVVYALSSRQDVVALKLPNGATVRDAVERSGLLEKYAEIDLARNKLGIFAKLTKPDAVLRDRDRVEIYRPLIADPKTVRRQRVADGKAMKKNAGE